MTMQVKITSNLLLWSLNVTILKISELQYTTNTAIKLFCCSHNSWVFINSVDTWQRISDSRAYFIWRKTEAKTFGRNNYVSRKTTLYCIL